MQHPPATLDEGRLVEQVQRFYHLRVRAMDFLPAGEDAYGYLLQLEDTRRLYLKLYRQTLYWDAVLLIPYMLYAGVAYGDPLKAIVPPIQTAGGALKVPLDDWIMALFPYIEGRAMHDTQPTPAQYKSLGAVLRALHRRAENVGIPAPEETFNTSAWREALMRVLSALPSATQSTESHRGEAGRLLASVRQDLLRTFGVFHEAAERAQAADVPFVLSHGDPTPGNVILSSMHDKLRLIDWDGVMLAPRERDLVHFHGDTLDHVLLGYGELESDDLHPDVLAYYRYRWVMQEVVDYGTRLLLEDHHNSQQAHDLAALQYALHTFGIPG